MTRERLDGLYLLLLGSLLFVLVGSFMERMGPGSMEDFEAVYYSSQCLLQHCDPYNESELLHLYLAEGGERSSDPLQRGQRQSVALCINLPTTVIFASPFAMLAWGPAHALWMIFTAGIFILAAFLAWDIGANHAPVISGGLIALCVVNSLSLLTIGNAAGIVVSLCVIAVWCFLKKRFVLAGVFCMAVSLAIKPHDAGLVWLYFLLAGGVYRKRALQTLALTVALCLPAILWVSQVAPHWIPELHSNLLISQAHGGINDPGPNTVSTRTAGMIIDLQAVIGVFRDDPRIYNPASYLVCGALLLAWSVRTLRSRFSQRNVRLALAAVVPLAMLVTYHRPYDAKLLLLTVPACAMLWAKGGAIGRIALVVTTAGIVLTADIPLAILVILTKNLPISTVGLSRQIMTVVLMRPATLILLVMGVFYLWVYLRRAGPETEDSLEQ
jgi:hypothetical protein